MAYIIDGAGYRYEIRCVLGAVFNQRKQLTLIFGNIR